MTDTAVTTGSMFAAHAVGKGFTVQVIDYGSDPGFVVELRARIKRDDVEVFEAFEQAAADLLRLLPATFVGHTWGAKWGTSAAAAAIATGRFSYSKSGISADLAREIRQAIGHTTAFDRFNDHSLALEVELAAQERDELAEQTLIERDELAAMQRDRDGLS